MAIAQADLTSVTAIALANQTDSDTTAQANLTLTLTNISDNAQYAAASLEAQATETVSQAEASATELVQLAEAEELLTTSGAADPMLILPIPDDPLLAGGGEAFLHLSDDVSVRSNPETWYYGYNYAIDNNWYGYSYYSGYYGGFAGDPFGYGGLVNGGLGWAGYGFFGYGGYGMNPYVAFGGIGFYNRAIERRSHGLIIALASDWGSLILWGFKFRLSLAMEPSHVVSVR